MNWSRRYAVIWGLLILWYVEMQINTSKGTPSQKFKSQTPTMMMSVMLKMIVLTALLAWWLMIHLSQPRIKETWIFRDLMNITIIILIILWRPRVLPDSKRINVLNSLIFKSQDYFELYEWNSLDKIHPLWRS